jgi:apolipoprotein N-acyltransferase
MPDPPRLKPSYIPFLLSGIFTVLAFPPINLWVFAWFALVPLMVKTRSLTSGVAFRRGWLTGLVANAFLLYWVALNKGAPIPVAFASFLGLLLVFPLYWGVFAALWSYLWKRWGDIAALLLPFIWVGLEVVKNAPEIGFPWLELGLTQIGFLPAAQLAEIGGIRLVSFWVVFVNVALFLFLMRKDLCFYILLLPLTITVIWGYWRLHNLPTPGPSLRAVIVQGNVDPLEKWLLDPDSSITLYEELTLIAAKGRNIDLVVWPETAAPVYLGHQTRYSNRLQKLVDEIDASLLTGASHYEFNAEKKESHDRFNSAFFFSSWDSVPRRYDKMRLVPFGERVPFQKWFPSLGELNFGQAEFTPGRDYSVFETENGVTVSAQICFESIFSQQTRRFVVNGARVLCNLTNDGWYGYSSGPFQHEALARYQCIITRCPLLRAANTGISLAADRAGRLINHLPLQRKGALTAEVLSGGDELTFYVRHGELIPWTFSLIALVGLIITIFRSPIKKR